MNNVGSSFLLLAVALLLLWLAVTNKLSNLLDAWDVATGKATTKTNASGPLAAAGVISGQQNVTLSLPSLPTLSTMANVGIS